MTDRLALLLRRAAFGVPPDQAARYAALGFDATLDELLHPERVDDALDAHLDALQGHLLDLQNIEDVQTWWLYRLARASRPLLETLTLFWHGHFAVANYKVQNPLAMHRHLETLRAGALGRFEDLLLAVSRDPAMLIWLDGNTNRKAAPNENYGRELLELYTLGIGNYTEADVQAAARAFTGWNLRDGAFFFDPNQHDPAPKTFLGETAPLDGADVVRRLAAHPATARRLVGKLFAFYAYPDPEPEVLAPLTDVYQATGGDVRAVLDALFRSDAFASDRSLADHVKSPVEFVMGSIRALGAEVRERDLIGVLRMMGQEVLNPPNVAGWPGGTRWVNPFTLLTRFNFAARLATARGEPYDGGRLDLTALLGEVHAQDEPGLLGRVLAAVGGLDLAPEARQALDEYLRGPLTYPPTLKGTPNAQQRRAALDARLRGGLLIALASADYQVG